MESGRSDDEPLDSLTGESVAYGESRSSALTPMGQVESIGNFARGLGTRRLKIALVVVGAFALAFAAFAAMT